MEKFKKIMLKILCPPVFWRIMLYVAAGALLFLTFYYGKENDIFAGAVYAFSAYALAVLCIAAWKSAKKLTKKVKTGGFEECGAGKLANRYFTDRKFRGKVALWRGVTVDGLYATFRLAIGLAYGSWWSVTLAGYHYVLGFLRTYLLFCYNRTADGEEDTAKNWRRYTLVGALLFALNLPMTGMTALMITQNSGFLYPGFTIYALAAYTFYSVIFSVVNLVREHRLNNPLFAAARVLNFVAALMSVFGLQTAMITMFSENGDGFRRAMNTVTGTAVLTSVIAFAVWMIRKGKREQARRPERLTEEKNEQIGK